MNTFEEWTCAKECTEDGSQCTRCKQSWQAAQAQIKGEIAAMCIELDCTMFEKLDKETYVNLRRRLRQLAAIPK